MTVPTYSPPTPASQGHPKEPNNAVDLRYWRFLGGKFEYERKIERVQILLRWLVKEMVQREVKAIEHQGEYPALLKMRYTEAAQSVTKLHLSGVERNIRQLIEAESLTLLDAAATLFRVYPLFNEDAVKAMDELKVPLLQQLSKLTKLQSDLSINTKKGDFSKLCTKMIAMPLYHFMSAETLRAIGQRPVVGDNSPSTQWSEFILDLVTAMKIDVDGVGIDRVLSSLVAATSVFELPPLIRNVVAGYRPLLISNVVDLYSNDHLFKKTKKYFRLIPQSLMIGMMKMGGANSISSIMEMLCKKAVGGKTFLQRLVENMIELKADLLEEKKRLNALPKGLRVELLTRMDACLNVEALSDLIEVLALENQYQHEENDSQFFRPPSPGTQPAFGEECGRERDSNDINSSDDLVYPQISSSNHDTSEGVSLMEDLLPSGHSRDGSGLVGVSVGDGEPSEEAIAAMDMAQLVKSMHQSLERCDKLSRNDDDEKNETVGRVSMLQQQSSFIRTFARFDAGYSEVPGLSKVKHKNVRVTPLGEELCQIVDFRKTILRKKLLLKVVSDETIIKVFLLVGEALQAPIMHSMSKKELGATNVLQQLFKTFETILRIREDPALPSLDTKIMAVHATLDDLQATQMFLLKNALIFDTEKVWLSFFRWIDFVVKSFSIDSGIVDLVMELPSDVQEKLWKEADGMVPNASQARETYVKGYFESVNARYLSQLLPSFIDRMKTRIEEKLKGIAPSNFRAELNEGHPTPVSQGCSSPSLSALGIAVRREAFLSHILVIKTSAKVNVLESCGFKSMSQTIAPSLKVFAKWSSYAIPAFLPNGDQQYSDHDMLVYIFNQNALMPDPIDSLCLCKGPAQLQAAQAAGYVIIPTPLLKGDKQAVMLCYRRCRYLDIYLQSQHARAEPSLSVGEPSSATINAINEFWLLGGTNMEPRLLTKRKAVRV